MKEHSKKEWYREWFNHPLYLRLYRHRNEEEAKQMVTMILYEISNMEANTFEKKTILDIACGAGRHAVEFAMRHHNVIANDLSEFLLSTAKMHADENQLTNIVFSNQNMKSITYDCPVDLVVQLFTSFGYFEDKADDLKTIQLVCEVLRPNGWYVLDMYNDEYVKHSLIRETSKEIDGISFHEKRSMTNEFFIKEITINNELLFVEKVRRYTKDELEMIIKDNNFNIKKVCGDYDGNAFTKQSHRVVIFAQKHS